MKASIIIALIASILIPKFANAEEPPASFAYILQASSFARTKTAFVNRLAGCGRDWIVLDAFFDTAEPWERTDISAIRAGQSGRKIIAYISIGEAEDYRPYWRKEWGGQGKLTAVAPSWLGKENPEWKGNYSVKYWQGDWQKIILAAIDDAMNHGFDGIYLDIVDGFEAFEKSDENRVNPETNQSFRRDMVDWVKIIAVRARKNTPDALVIPQNGSQLLLQEDYLNTISAIGIEDLYTNGNKLQAKSDTSEVLGYLEKMAGVKKPVLLTEYPKKVELQELSKKMASEHRLVWLVTDRQLKTLGKSGK
jgi:cysteinyl-tRNA synthetase, unknown class